jgi:hypothetical protein
VLQLVFRATERRLLWAELGLDGSVPSRTQTLFPGCRPGATTVAAPIGGPTTSIRQRFSPMRPARSATQAGTSLPHPQINTADVMIGRNWSIEERFRMPISLGDIQRLQITRAGAPTSSAADWSSKLSARRRLSTRPKQGQVASRKGPVHRIVAISRVQINGIDSAKNRNRAAPCSRHKPV